MTSSLDDGYMGFLDSDYAFFGFFVVVGWGRDVTSHSFGEGYATRSDEEGFGGIYGGNDPLSSQEKTPSKIIHESHPGLYSLSLPHEI